MKQFSSAEAVNDTFLLIINLLQAKFHLSVLLCLWFYGLSLFSSSLPPKSSLQQYEVNHAWSVIK